MKNIYWKIWINFWCFLAWLDGAGKDKKKDAVDWIQGDPEYSVYDTSKIVVIGDSSANHFCQRLQRYWEVTPLSKTYGFIKNYARNGVPIDYFIKPNPDGLNFNTVIIMVGGNNIGLFDEDVDTVVKKHFDLYKLLPANKKIVVGLSPFNGTEGFSPWKNKIIKEVNDKLKMIYGDEFIDVFPSEMLPSFTDGVHHTYHYDLQIIKNVLYKL